MTRDEFLRSAFRNLKTPRDRKRKTEYSVRFYLIQSRTSTVRKERP